MSRDIVLAFLREHSDLLAEDWKSLLTQRMSAVGEHILQTAHALETAPVDLARLSPLITTLFEDELLRLEQCKSDILQFLATSAHISSMMSGIDPSWNDGSKSSKKKHQDAPLLFLRSQDTDPPVS